MTKTIGLGVLTSLLLALACVAADAPSASRPGLVVYPANVANPRTPTVPADPNGAKGSCMGIEADLTYPLAPLLSFTKGGEAAFSLRDNQRRKEKKPLVLQGDKTSLAVIITQTSEGRKLRLLLASGDKVVAKADSPNKVEPAWTALILRWNASDAVIEADGKAVASVKLQAPFNPIKATVKAYHVDELSLRGDGGTFKLGWESGYAAMNELETPSDAITATLHGLDAMVVSTDPSKRDCPTVQVCNATGAERKAVFQFSVTSELRNHAAEWTQDVMAPALSTSTAPIKFPFAFDADIYHLSTKVDGATLGERDGLRNFLFAPRRGDKAGPPKFGFHCFGVTTLGSWPDALPAHWLHSYSNWGYIVGPMWDKDWNGEFGLDPDTPPEEWNWDTRVETAIKEGRKTFVCALSVPYFPWMREKEYDASYMNKTYPWGKAGGRPNFERYRQFIKALAERYKGKVRIYELDNEPNTVSYSGKPAADYADVMKVGGDAIHAADPDAKVFGISGTAQFVDFIKDSLATGAVKHIDGVSWHTYTTPMLPGESGLAQMLKRARETIRGAGRDLPVMNSETGVFTACRETADRPIDKERLSELIKQGVLPLAVPTGWPSHALDEWTAAKSMAQNITINFASGTQQFFFFGWNPVVEKGKSWWGEAGEGCFNIFARVKDGTMTPSLHTLACAVAMNQMEGVVIGKSSLIDQEGVFGGLFDKADGGQLAILWSNGGRRTVMLRSACQELDTTSLFGVEKKLSAKGGPDFFLHRIELCDQPVYLHLSKTGLTLSQSPVIGCVQETEASGGKTVKFTLVNRFDAKWAGAVSFSKSECGAFSPSKVEFSLEPGARTSVETKCDPPMGTARGIHIVEAGTALPDGSPFVFPIEIDVRPSFAVNRLPDGFSLNDLGSWKPDGAEMPIDRPDQVAIGRPPKLSSLQEERYWKGSEELSAKVAAGYDARGFYSRVVVHDKNMGPLKKWPGVEGSCVEFFLDFRSSAKGLGKGPYENGVGQIIVKPALKAGEKVELWLPNFGNLEPFKGVEAVGGVIDGASYWVGLFVPWTALDPAAKTPEAIGFDVAIDGPPAGAVGRKSQIILFGGADNCRNASLFGAGRMGK